MSAILGAAAIQSKRRPNSPQHSDRCRTESLPPYVRPAVMLREVLERRHGWFGPVTSNPQPQPLDAAGPNHPLFRRKRGGTFPASSELSLWPRENRCSADDGSGRFLVLHRLQQHRATAVALAFDQDRGGQREFRGLSLPHADRLDVANGMPIGDLLAAVLALLDLDHPCPVEIDDDDIRPAFARTDLDRDFIAADRGIDRTDRPLPFSSINASRFLMAGRSAPLA